MPILLSVGGYVLIVFICALAIAILDTQEIISDPWAKALWGFIVGSHVGAVAAVTYTQTRGS